MGVIKVIKLLGDLGARDRIYCFARMMGFVIDAYGNIDYFKLEKALEFFGKTSCSYELRQKNEKTSIVGYKIGDCFQIIFEVSRVDETSKQGSSEYPEVDLLIRTVDEREYKDSSLAFKNQVEFKSGLRCYCDSLGKVTLSADQVISIITALNRLRNAYNDWVFSMETH